MRRAAPAAEKPMVDRRAAAAARLAAFRSAVRAHWKKRGRRDLPWRKTKDPYRVLVSEVMLQQTQVPRAIGKYESFLKKFPDVRALAGASLAEVLQAWSGLGYNRRGKYLRDAAVEIVETYGGRVPKDAAALRRMPGVGPYTASAVRVFAWNEPDILIETNIRTALIHHFYQGRTLVNDKRLLPIIKEAAEGQDPRKWHWALMDYGAHLKKSGVRNNRRSAHYAKQPKFEGSLRQVRGAILRELPHTGFTKSRRVAEALAGLERDGLIKKEKGKWRIA